MFRGIAIESFELDNLETAETWLSEGLTGLGNDEAASFLFAHL